ncbi:MAG: radical SAM protein [Proteobacteria bacterium]|nr:radical SAM protein [Pseudomonadota bacterium]MBU1716772.1 radical SAM protein [Pseudomonadota bacterium]
MAGRSGRDFIRPELTDLIPLPTGSELFVLPGRRPVGIEPASGEAVNLDCNPENPSQGIRAVAAFMAPAHTAILSAAFEKKRADVPVLPLFAYTAVGWYRDQFWVCGFRSDSDPRQEPDRFEPENIRNKTNKRLKQFPANRLIQHLGKCSLTYGCPAAVNYFMEKWEAPLPTSPVCNASCLGCISLQPSGCCPATQDRIKFTPSPEEIAQVAVPHLKRVKKGIVSFGQGCEGEPLMQAKTIEQAIKLIRQETANGTINLNTNASLPQEVASLAEAGLDAIRVSMNSARPEFHQKYYRPKGFSFDEVRQSIAAMKQKNRFVSLNYFILPGFTDDPDEFEALCRLVEDYQPNLIQLRNLNMDPDWYLDEMNYTSTAPPLGITNWFRQLKEKFPALRFGYFNPPLR